MANSKNAKSIKTKLKNTSKNVENEKFYYSREEDRVIVSDVLEDFNKRREERKNLELSWELNMNFMLGNQYSFVNSSGEVTESPKNYFWEEREVYNHIAPIIDTRLAKLGKVRPSTSVRPAGNTDSDLYCAKLSKAILSAVTERCSLSDIITQATIWSEVTGTAFYKVTWDENLGDALAIENGKVVKNGDISISVCPPFEIFPDSLASFDIESCESIIHARAYPAHYVEECYGIKLEGKDIDTFSLQNSLTRGAVTGLSNITKLAHSLKHDHVLVIERYHKPCDKFPNGKLTIVAGDKLVYDGDMPFVLGRDSSRQYPFIRQVSSAQVGNFFGVSVIERCIPIQRAYNAIKNRKHEFMARISSGVLAVEDGSVDIDNIEEEGLAPGKILVYRNGSTPPRFIDPGSVPNDFDSEESRLLNEFITVSGVSELMRDSTVPASVSSGTALSLLIEQDETRLSVTAEYIRSAVKKIAQFIIRLYKQFATDKRLVQSSDENGDIEVFYWSSSDLTSDDVVLDTTNELTESPAQRKSMLLDLYKNGILNDENGRMSNRNRAKLIEALGLGIWENASDLTEVHIKRANKENLGLIEAEVLEVDDHQIHIDEHTKFLLSDSGEKLSKEAKQKIIDHILAHKSLRYAEMSAEQGR